MLAHIFVRRVGFLVVLIAGVGCAGASFAAEDEAGGKSKKAGADIPRELAMRPLPTYRIEPPDIIQIEVTSAKAGRGGENQPAKKSDAKTPSGGAGTESGSASLNVTGAITPAENKSGTGRINATFVGSGSPGENSTGSTTVTAGRLTISSNEPVAGESLNKVGSGTLTLSGPNTYTGTTTVTSGGSGTYEVFVGDAKPSATFVAGNAVPSVDSVKITGSGRVTGGADLGTGQYLVGPDGTINMRQYGTVQVTGMTVGEVKSALEKHLSNYMDSPEVWVNVLGYNSKVYYIITDGAGYGDNVRRIPICGNETVLDAVASVGGLSQMSSKKIWLSRPSPTNSKKGMILTVDYGAITQRGATETNYQIMPGDRIFIAGDSAIAINNKLGKVTAPVERAMGIISLGTSTIQSVKRLMGEEKDHQGPGEDD